MLFSRFSIFLVGWVDDMMGVMYSAYSMTEDSFINL